MSDYQYLTREQWGGTWIGTPTPEMPLDAEMFIHHVGAPGVAWMGGVVGVGFEASKAAAIRVFQNLNSYAQNSKGYQFLDYDLLVWYDKYNDICWIAEGRGPYRSAATLDRNEQGEAICVCGNFGMREPTPAELEGTARAVAIAAEKSWTRPQPTILGHKDNPAHPNATTCPGPYLYAQLPWIRQRFAQLVAAPPVEPIPVPPPTGNTYTVKAGDSWWGISRAYGITVDQLLALNPPATAETVIHPGDVLNVPGTATPTPPPVEPKAPNGLTAAQNVAAGSLAATPPSNPVIRDTLIHNNSPWLQQVLCAIPTLPADGGGPIYPPLWVGEGRIGDGPAVFRQFGDGGQAALAYWQSKNGLAPDGVYGPQTEQRLRAVRGR